jgi:hypothetical protein
MVLVDERARGRGIATALLHHALEFLDRRRIPTIRLDATPAGRALYHRFGFVEQFQLIRFEGTPSSMPNAADTTTVLPGRWDMLAALDRQATGTDRRSLLLRMFAEQPESVRGTHVQGRLAGFIAARPGNRAIQIGPCIAAPEGGIILLTDAMHRYGGKNVYLDIPVPNTAAIREVEACGLTVQRHFTRMCRGVPCSERVDWLWASSGPENG